MLAFLGAALSFILKLLGAQKPQAVKEGEDLGSAKATGAQQAVAAKAAQAEAQAVVNAPATESQLEDRLSKGTF